MLDVSDVPVVTLEDLLRSSLALGDGIDRSASKDLTYDLKETTKEEVKK